MLRVNNQELTACVVDPANTTLYHTNPVTMFIWHVNLWSFKEVVQYNMTLVMADNWEVGLFLCSGLGVSQVNPDLAELLMHFMICGLPGGMGHSKLIQ